MVVWKGLLPLLPPSQLRGGVPEPDEDKAIHSPVKESTRVLGMGVAVLFLGGTQLELSQVDNASAGTPMGQVLQTDPLSPGLWDSWEVRGSPRTT